MSTVTFSSGVHAGTRASDSDMNQAWFDASTTSQFTNVTLELADVQFLTQIEGRIGDREPVLLTFEGGGMADAYAELKAIDARDLLNGQPFSTLSGWRDAVARDGKLVQASIRLYGDDAARTEWGVLTQVRNRVVRAQLAWTVTAIFHPCDALFLTGTSTVHVTPDAYSDLPAA